MTIHLPVRCFLFGEGSLGIRCAELLLDHHLPLLGVVSSDPALQNWAKRRQLVGGTTIEEGMALLRSEPADYLLNIGYHEIGDPLWDDLVLLSNQGIVGYHEGPLPRYAGAQAAVWAVLNQESDYGVTWYHQSQPASGLGSAAVLVQRAVTIAPGETTAGLRRKGEQAACAGLVEILTGLQAEGGCPDPVRWLRVKPLVQQRLALAGILDWERSAHALAAQVRALTVAETEPNPLGLPKLGLGDDWVTLQHLEVLEMRSREVPGTIVAVAADEIRVATATYDVALRGLRYLDGRDYPLGLATSAAGLHDGSSPEAVSSLVVGMVVRQLADGEAERLNEADRWLAVQESFWLQRLWGVEPLKLPYPQPLLAQQSARAIGFPSMWQIPETLWAWLEQQAPGAPEMALLATLTAYLARLCDRDRFALGWQGPELRQAIAQSLGLVVEQVPLTVAVAFDQPFAQWCQAFLAQVQQTRDHCGYYQDLGLRYPPLRSQTPAERSPRFPVALELADSLLTRPNQNRAEQVTLVVAPGERRCLWEVSARGVSLATLVALQNQFLIFLQGLMAQADQPLGEIPLVSATESQGSASDATPVVASPDTSPDTCMHALFEAQVHKVPEAIALHYGDQSLSYHALNARANQLAHHLRALGVQPDQFVGVCMDRSLELIVAVLGILKAGAAYLPLDPAYPPERLAFMLEDAQPVAILTQRHLLPHLPHETLPCLCLDQDWLALEEYSAENLASVAQPQHLAYTIYTSGSTGNPKGVMIEHRSLVNFVQGAIATYGLCASDRVLQFASISFDIAVEEIFCSLAIGATLVLRTADMMSSVPHFLRQCATYGITVLDLPTAYWHLLVAELAEPSDCVLPPQLRLVLIGGEAINAKRVAQWQKLAPAGVTLINTYGPTETTVVVTTQVVNAPTPGSAIVGPAESLEVPIGWAMPNVQLYVLDSRRQPMPLGVPGELYVGGPSVARGYWQRPDRNTEKFVPHPFRPQERLYRTGDLVRRWPDGSYTFLGRIDHQVKIRGFRVELSEIEIQLKQHPQVEEAIVLLREDTPHNKRLVAYLLPKPGQSLTMGDVRHTLQRQLPDYMIPAAWVLLEALPLTPNGKIDRQKLPVPEQGSTLAIGDTPFVEPQGAIERQLASLWEEVLGLPSVGLYDNFFAIGGNSLLAVQLFLRIEKVFGKTIGLAKLFQYPTLQTLAQSLRDEGAIPAQTSLVEIQPQGSKPPLFFVNSISYAKLLGAHMGTDYPLYGLNIFGLTTTFLKSGATLTLAQMAEHLIVDIQRIQPQGPYFLGGYCNDTKLALEIAQQLQHRGETVALMAMIDAMWDEGTAAAPSSLDTLKHNLKHLGWTYVVEKVKRRLSYIGYSLTLNQQRLMGSLRDRLGHHQTSLDQDLALLQAFHQASDNYSPQPYAGALTLIFCSELPTQDFSTFEQLAQAGITVHRVPGYHHNLFLEPQVQILAAQLRSAIDQGLSQVLTTDIINTTLK